MTQSQHSFRTLLQQGGSIERSPSPPPPLPRQEQGSLPLPQSQLKNCTDPLKVISQEYPDICLIRKPSETNNGEIICGGVLWDHKKILTSAECLYQTNVTTGLSVLDELDYNPLLHTFRNEMQVNIGPYCKYGLGFGLYNIVGASLMDDFRGNITQGSGLAVYYLQRNVTEYPQNRLPQIRKTKIFEGELLKLAAHQSKINTFYHQKQNISNSALPSEIAPLPLGTCNGSCDGIEIAFGSKISDDECLSLLAQINLESESPRTVHLDTESCMIINRTQQANYFCGEYGSPVYDADGKIVGIVTNIALDCEIFFGVTSVLAFTDFSKNKVQEFMDKVEQDLSYFPSNITDEMWCQSGEEFEEAPFVVSLQFKRPSTFPRNGSSRYVHYCGGSLIDDGKRVLTAASCIWNKNFTSKDIQNQGLDFRDKDKFIGKIDQVFAALTPRCCHFNETFTVVEANKFMIHPLYNGDPQKGYDVAVLVLREALPAQHSLQIFKDSNLFQDENNLEYSEIVFESVNFYGWGAKFPEEVSNYLDFWNNYYPIKKIPMQFAALEECANAMQSDNVRIAMLQNQSLCLTYLYQTSSSRICQYDSGGPLIGKVKNQKRSYLLGVTPWSQFPQCEDSQNRFGFFLDVETFQEIIFQYKNIRKSNMVLSQNFKKVDQNFTEVDKKGKDDENKFPLYILIIIVIFCLGFVILVLMFLIYRRNQNIKQQNIKNQHQTSYQFSSMVQFDTDVYVIYQKLRDHAQKEKIFQTNNKARRYSDIPATLNHILDKNLIEHKILGYSQPIMDDTILYTKKEQVPQSPFALAANQKNHVSIQFQKPLKRNFGLEDRFQGNVHNRMIALADQIVQSWESKPKNGIVGVESVSSQIITGNTRPREEFDLYINYEEELEVKEKIGAGAFGSVYKAFWKTKNIEVAVKIVHGHILEELLEDAEQEGSAFKNFLCEIGLSARINNPRLVKCYGACLNPPNVCLVLEYMQNGSLDKFIQNYPGDIPLPVVMKTVQGIAEGLCALHPTVVHRDLKPQNILLDETYGVKLADFGVSRLKEQTYLSDTTVRGTPAFIAPEVFQGESVDEKCDVYALGLIMWQMITKKQVWENISMPVAIMVKVVIKHERPQLPPHCPPQLSKLIQRCWAPNPKSRPSAHEVVQKIILLRQVANKPKTPFYVTQKCECEIQNEDQGSQNFVF